MKKQVNLLVNSNQVIMMNSSQIFPTGEEEVVDADFVEVVVVTLVGEGEDEVAIKATKIVLIDTTEMSNQIEILETVVEDTLEEIRTETMILAGLTAIEEVQPLRSEAEIITNHTNLRRGHIMKIC